MSKFSWKKTPSTAGILAASLDVQKVWGNFSKSGRKWRGVRNHGPEKTKRQLGEKFFAEVLGKKYLWWFRWWWSQYFLGGVEILETCYQTLEAVARSKPASRMRCRWLVQPLAIAVSEATWACQAWSNQTTQIKLLELILSEGFLTDPNMVGVEKMAADALLLVPGRQFIPPFSVGYVKGWKMNRSCCWSPCRAFENLAWKMTSLIKSRPWGITRPSRSTKGGWDDIVSNLFQSQLRKC